jgi:hypothetical protein
LRHRYLGYIVTAWFGLAAAPSCSSSGGGGAGGCPGSLGLGGCPISGIYYTTCGDPVCTTTDGGTGFSPCNAEEKAGAGCEVGYNTCDPGLGCGVLLQCATSDPKAPGCPK